MVYSGIQLIGFFSPLILIFISLIFIKKSKKMMFYYIIFYIFNIILNIALKNIIKEPRPDNEQSFLDIERPNFDTYGMPSGHAQLVWYNIYFIFIKVNNNKIKYLSLLIGCITIYQRYINKNHNELQLFFGSIIGILNAIISNNIINRLNQ